MAAFLRGCHHYDNVFTEYPVTLDEIQHFGKNKLTPSQFPWRKKTGTTTLSIDIVVEKDDEFVPIELKYKTKAVKSKNLAFGESNKKNFSRNILENQLAYPNNKYLVWKDVRRLEVIYDAFKKVVGGVVVFITTMKFIGIQNVKTTVLYVIFLPLVSVIKGKKQCREIQLTNASHSY